jgi:hypothetical protein
MEHNRCVPVFTSQAPPPAHRAFGLKLRVTPQWHDALGGQRVDLPHAAGQMRALERGGDTTGRLALLEELKGLPFGAAWDHHCPTQGVPVGMGFMDEIRAYERTELAKRA